MCSTMEKEVLSRPLPDAYLIDSEPQLQVSLQKSNPTKTPRSPLVDQELQTQKHSL